MQNTEQNIVEINGICSFCNIKSEIKEQSRENGVEHIKAAYTACFCIITGSPNNNTTEIENPVVHNIVYLKEQEIKIPETQYKEAVMRNGINELLCSKDKTINSLKKIEQFLKNPEKIPVEGFPRIAIKGSVGRFENQYCIIAKIINIPQKGEKISMSATCSIKGKIQVIRPENAVTGIYISCDNTIIPAAVPNGTSLAKKIEKEKLTKGDNISIKGEIYSRKYTDGIVTKNRVIIKPKTINLATTLSAKKRAK